MPEATIGKEILVIWDGLKAHRSRRVRRFVDSNAGRLQLECLPAYGQELNPAEYIWGHLKQHELAHFRAQNLGHTQTTARCQLRSMQRLPTLIRAFWQQAEVPL